MKGLVLGIRAVKVWLFDALLPVVCIDIFVTISESVLDDIVVRKVLDDSEDCKGHFAVSWPSQLQPNSRY